MKKTNYVYVILDGLFKTVVFLSGTKRYLIILGTLSDLWTGVPTHYQRSFTYSSKNWSSVETVNDENPTFKMHNDIRNGQIDDQLVSGRSNVLISESVYLLLKLS